MLRGVIYNKKSGEIQHSIVTPREDVLQSYRTADEDYITVPLDTPVNASTHYVSGGAMVACSPVAIHPSSAVAKPGETVSIQGLPTSCWLWDSYKQQLVQVTNGQYSFTVNEDAYVGIRLQGKYEGECQVVYSALTTAKEKAKLEIDAAAEAARLRVVTPGSGQAMTYLRKADAAASFLAGDTLSDAQMQRIEDEAARLGITAQQAAETLAATAAAWEGLDASIDDIRLRAKQSIDAANTGAAIDAIMKTVSWPV